MENKEYIEGLLSQDNAVLERIYQDFSGRIRFHIEKRGGTAEDAKDVFQDALLVIYQKAQMPDFELTAGFYTYLYSVCHFIWDRKKKKKSNNTVTIPEDERLTLDEDIERDIIKREKQKVFKDNLAKLGEICRKILRLFFLGKSMTEIAEAASLENEHTARTRKYRCAKQLEKLVQSDVRYREITDKTPARKSQDG